MQGDGIQNRAEGRKDTMPNKEPEKLSLFGKILAGGCVAALGASLASESVFTMSIVSVTLLAIVALFHELLH